jgi:RNA polymerase sigma-70 factor (ECF subfamily)
MSDDPDHLRVWAAERPRLLGLAYTVLGSWQDAEDVVSEAWLRLAGRAPDDPDAWLTTVVSRLALDAATTAAKRRETYVGQWLPEAVVGKSAADDGPQDRALLGEQVDLAFVRLLQSLSPVDRVIVVLADVGGLEHREIAEVVGTTAPATRQRLRRARSALAKGDDRGLPVGADRATLELLASRLNDGDLGALVEQLSEGCVLWTDAGGLTRAARNPIHGPDRVRRFLAGLIAKFGMPRVGVADAVGGPVLRAVSTDMTRIVTVEVLDGQITGLQIQQNPGKIITPTR